MVDVKMQFHDLVGTNTADVFPAMAWRQHQQGYVKTSTPSHYTCLENVLTGQKTSVTEWCSRTPWHKCHTGCPAVGGNNCAGPRPSPNATCNMCRCNQEKRNCPRSLFGHPCASGWYPDPLLEVPDGIPVVESGFTQPIHIEVCIPYNVTAGNYTGRFVMMSQTNSNFKSVHNVPVNVTLEVWDIDLPLLSDADSFNTAFSFNSSLKQWYPDKMDAEIWTDWFTFLSKHRIPGDMLHLASPRPINEYRALAASGAKWINLLYASSGRSQGSHRFDLQEDLRHAIEQIGPALQNLTAREFSKKLYIYGFDEMPIQFNESLYKIFGALKRRWPEVQTMAALKWPILPSDLPLDIWVDEYIDYGSSNHYSVPTAKETLRQQWLASNDSHSFWWYWCIGPTDPRQMNTFLERPAIEARLLFWLASLHAIDGMLYYSVNRWVDQCPTQRPCRTISRINNTALIDFDPATWNGSGGSITDGGGANGDGSFLYPGPDGPVGTIRLSNIADGIEDWQLFKLLGTNGQSISHADDLISQLVSNATEWNNNPLLLEQVRRQAAHRILSARSRDVELWSPADLQVAINDAILRQAPSVVVPGGTYRFERGVSLLIHNATDLAILARQPLHLVFSGSAGVSFVSCARVSLGNISIDYDPPPEASYSSITFSLVNSSDVLTEDMTIRSAPYMAITAFTGGGNHTFRRLRFSPHSSGQLASMRDAIHFSDVRIGPTIEDSAVGWCGDDFINVKNTLMLLLRCDSATSCIFVNPHVSGEQTIAFGGASVLATARAGDRVSFYEWPSQNMVMPQLQTNSSSGSAHIEALSALSPTPAEMVIQAAALEKSLVGVWPWTDWTNQSMPFGTKELWQVNFSIALPRKIWSREAPAQTTLINLDDISCANSRILVGI
eukprot:SAG31_NODE_78_length_27447_cov_83.819877_6_plen_896_part_00